MNTIEKYPLNFDRNGEFKILLLGDPHQKYTYTEKTEDAMRLIEASLDRLKPDLAIYMGDLVSDNITRGRSRDKATYDEFKCQFDRLANPMISRGIPFSTVFGNHDDEKIYTKQQMLEILRSYPGCIFENGEPETGVGNFFIPVYSNGNKVFGIWMIDSGCGVPDRKGEYAYIMPDQIEWFEKLSAQLREENSGEPLPGIVIQHIPVIEEYRLLRESSKLNPFASRGNSRFSDKYYVIADRNHTSGDMSEGPCSPHVDSGQFESWKRTGGVVGAFFGHDHINDFCGEVDGILLGQCRAVGFDIYGDGMRQGVRLITVRANEPRKLDTRMYSYRELVGEKCLSLNFYDRVFNDKQHYIIETGAHILSLTAACAAASLAATAAVKYIKRKKKG